MRIAVIGSGGVGGCLGARLARGGADVAFLARGAHLAAMLGKPVAGTPPLNRAVADILALREAGQAALPRVPHATNAA